MTDNPIALGNQSDNFYNDWTIVFKSGAVLTLKGVALVRHTKGDGSLEKIVVTRSIPLGAEAAMNSKGEKELDLAEISGVFLAGE